MGKLGDVLDSTPHEWGDEPPTAEADASLAPASMSSGELAEGFDLEETILGNVAQNPRIERMIQDAMAGLLPYGRALASYEPDKLNARHISVIMLRAVGYRQNRIVELTGYSVGAVSVILRHPYSRMILSAILAEGAKQSINISAQVQREAPKMLKIVQEITEDRDVKPETRVRAAFGWLGMYERLKEKEASPESESFRMDKDDAARLIEAIQESKHGIEVPYVLVSAPSAATKPDEYGYTGLSAEHPALPGDGLSSAAAARQAELEAQLEAVLDAKLGSVRPQGQANGAELILEPGLVPVIPRSSIRPAHRPNDEHDGSVPNTSFSPPSAVGVRLERQGGTSDVEEVA